MRTDFDRRQSALTAARETLATAALGVLYPFGYLRGRHQRLRQRDMRTVVFVHGLAANRACFYPLQAWLYARGHRRQLNFDHGSSPSIEALGIELKRRIDREVKGGRIDLVCHSLGGLVARVYLQELGGARRVDRCITIGTPHRGTWAAKWIPMAFVRQLSPDGPFIAHLDALPPPDVEMHSLAADGDALVLPRDSALCSFGQTRMLTGLGHNGLLLAPTLFSAVEHILGGEKAGPR